MVPIWLPFVPEKILRVSVKIWEKNNGVKLTYLGIINFIKYFIAQYNLEYNYFDTGCNSNHNEYHPTFSTTNQNNGRLALKPLYTTYWPLGSTTDERSFYKEKVLLVDRNRARSTYFLITVRDARPSRQLFARLWFMLFGSARLSWNSDRSFNYTRPALTKLLNDSPVNEPPAVHVLGQRVFFNILI